MIRALLPGTRGETLLYAVDFSSLSILFVQWATESLGLYILLITALSITFTFGVKVYNFVKNENRGNK